MIHYTNKKNLPAQVIHLMDKIFGNYDSGKSEFSVTQLIDSPRRIQLIRRYDYEQDYSSLWAAFVGSLLHAALEKNSPNGLKEVRLYDTILGNRISGQIDYFDLDSRLLLDYKTGGETSLFKFDKPDWEKQLNLYAHLLRRHGLFPLYCNVLRFAVDWRDDFTGGVPSDLVSVDLWDDHTAELFMIDRVTAHATAAQLPDYELPLCTSEEMWEKTPVWALMKAKQKRSVKNFSSVSDLHTYGLAKKLAHKTDTAPFVLNKGYYIEKRPGERTRCERFCICKDQCDQYKEYKDAAE